ncbi:MAG: DoxX family membrane protein, partial [Candidatus Acidiferrales bacterium]
MAARTIAAALRILIGAALIYLGAQKLSDTELLYGGLMHRIYDLGEPFAFYEKFLIRFVEFRQEKVVYAVAIGEILVGTSFVLGALVSLGALAGTFLVANFALATTAGNLP